MATRPTVKVPIPDAGTDRSRYGWLTWTVTACFIVGLVWPTLAGLKFVQRPPGSSPAKPEEPEPPPLDIDPGPDPTPVSEPGIDSRAVAHLRPNVTQRQSVRLGESSVANCYGNARQELASCDQPNLVGVIEEPIAKLARCDAALGVKGELSLGVELNFERGHITRVQAGRRTTLPKSQTALLVACARDVLVGTSLAHVAHEHTSYWVYYPVRFLPAGSALAVSSGVPVEMVDASGQGTITRKSAIVRDAPTRQAPISARLEYGTRVNVTGRAGEWYRVKYAAGKSVGWVHRAAIGM